MDRKQFDIEAGTNIRRRREALGISQSRLAGYLGISFQQVQKYERGVNSVRLYTAVRLAALFRCGIGDLYALGAGFTQKTADEAFDLLQIAFVETIHVVSLSGVIPEAEAERRFRQIEGINRQSEDLKSFIARKTR